MEKKLQIAATLEKVTEIIDQVEKKADDSGIVIDWGKVLQCSMKFVSCLAGAFSVKK